MACSYSVSEIYQSIHDSINIMAMPASLKTEHRNTIK